MATSLETLENLFTSQDNVTLEEYLRLVSEAQNELGNSQESYIKRLKIFKSAYNLNNFKVKSFKIVKK